MKRNTYRLGEHPEARSFLAQIGITEDELVGAVRLGEYGRDNTDLLLHPPSYPGTVAWADTLRGLAVVLRVKGWTRREVAGLSVVMSPNEREAIAVQTGDESTANFDATPTTKYPRGTATQKAVQVNVQLFLRGFEAEFEPTVRRNLPGPPEGCRTWFLLRHRPEKDKVVLVELSSPKKITEEGQVVGWNPRVIFPPIDVSGGPSTDRRRDSDDGDTGSIDVPVTRK